VGLVPLLIRYTTGDFSEDYIPTVFLDTIVQRFVDGKLHNLQLCFVPGTSDYERVRSVSYQSTDVFLVCYSVVQSSSFDSVENIYVPEIRRHCPDTPIIIVACKNDLKMSPAYLERGVGPEAIGRWMKKMETSTVHIENLAKIEHMAVSAKTKDGVSELFDDVIRNGLGMPRLHTTDCRLMLKKMEIEQVQIKEAQTIKMYSSLGINEDLAIILCRAGLFDPEDIDEECVRDLGSEFDLTTAHKARLRRVFCRDKNKNTNQKIIHVQGNYTENKKVNQMNMILNTDSSDSEDVRSQ